MRRKLLLLSNHEEVGQGLEKKFLRNGDFELTQYLEPGMMTLSSDLDLSAFQITVIDVAFAGDPGRTCRFIYDFRLKNRNPVIAVCERLGMMSEATLKAVGCHSILIEKPYRLVDYVPSVAKQIVDDLESVLAVTQA